MIFHYKKRTFILCVWIWMTVIFAVKAQTDSLDSPTPCFEVLSGNVGCAYDEGFIVTVDGSCSGADSKLILYDYGDGEGKVSDTEHAYTKAGQYYIKQYIGGTVNSGDSISEGYLVQVYEPDQPTIDIQLCADKQVTVKVTEGAFTNYIVDYGDGTFDTMAVGAKASLYTYQDTQPKTLNFSGYVNGMTTGCGVNPHVIVPIDSLEKPELNHIEVLQDGSIQITLKTSDTGLYRLYENISSGKKNEYDLGSNQSSYLIQRTDVASETYNYRLEALDWCNSSPVSADAILATYDLELSTELGKNTLKWKNSTLANADCVIIYRESAQIGVISNPSEQAYFEDTDVKCGETYCYRLQVSLSNGLASSLSRKKCIETSSDSHPNPLNYVWATISDSNNVALSWAIPKDEIIEPANIRIRKMIGDEGMFPIQNIVIPYSGNETGYLDTATNANKIRYAYYISYMDECGNYSPETVINRAMVLDYKTEDITNDGVDDDMILTWNPYQGVSDVTYYLEKLDTNGVSYANEILENQDSVFLRLSLLSLDSQSITYRIKAVSKLFPELIAYSNTITYSQEAKLIFPTAFSPNWDGVNDEFRVYAFFIDENRPIKVRIMNRWGNPVYAYDNGDYVPIIDDEGEENQLDFAWDGTSNGQHVPPGVYIIQIEAFDMLGNVIKKRKTLTVLR